MRVGEPTDCYQIVGYRQEKKIQEPFIPARSTLIKDVGENETQCNLNDTKRECPVKRGKENELGTTRQNLSS